jgi:hypothetical protein
MKYFLSIALIIVSISITKAQTQNYKVICVGFYNLENLYDTINQEGVNDEEFTPDGSRNYTPAVFKDKIDKLGSVIAGMGTETTPDGPAILGVAEIENRTVLETLVQHPSISKRNYKIVHFDSPDLRGIDVGLLYNPKYFKPISSEKLEVPLKNADGSRYYTRDVLFVTGVLDGDTVHIFVNHWPSRRGGEEASAPSRALAAGVCKQKIDSIMAINSGSRVFLMGDLNDEPVSPSVTKVIGATGDINKIKAGGMFNPWVDFFKKGLGTLAYQDAWGLFDQILFSAAYLDKKQESYHFHKSVIYNKEFMVQKTGKYRGYPMRTYDGNRYNGGYSDHFPTYIILLKPVQ